MDNLEELESLLDSVGSNVVWKRKIGERLIWLSPISFVAQEKVTEVLTSGNGISGLSDSKRLTLSFAIVGIEDKDFSGYLKRGAVFPGLNNTKTTFDRYLYHKLGDWGGQYVDDIFTVYADLMDEFQRQNLANVKFESMNSVQEELSEAEEKVSKLKQSMAEKAASLPQEKASGVEPGLSTDSPLQSSSGVKEEPKMVINDRFR